MFPGGKDKTQVGVTSASGRGGDGVHDVPSSSAIGTSSKMLDRLRNQVNEQKGRQVTKDYFEKESGTDADANNEAKSSSNLMEASGAAGTSGGMTMSATADDTINEEMAKTDEMH